MATRLPREKIRPRGYTEWKRNRRKTAVASRRRNRKPKASRRKRRNARHEK